MDDDFDFDFPAAGGGGAMGGFGDENYEAMDDLYTRAGAGAAGAGEEDAEGNYNAAMKVGEEKEIGKEGLRKNLVKEGEGLERPDAGDEVEGALDSPFRRDFWVFAFWCREQTVNWIGSSWVEMVVDLCSRRIGWRSALHGDADGWHQVRLQPGSRHPIQVHPGAR